MLKSKINALVTSCKRFFDRKRLKSVTTKHSVEPVPQYVSQFVGIFPQSISPDQKLTSEKKIKEFGAKNAEEFSFWAWRNCGIACVKMILDLKTKRKKTLMTLTKQGIQLGGYVLHENGVFVDRGWYHFALVNLLREHGVSAKRKKWQTLESVAQDVIQNKYVILSVTLPSRQYISLDGEFKMLPHGKTSGHLILVTGVKIEKGQVLGFNVHDPRGLPMYQANTWLSAKNFKRVFSGRTIVAC